MWYNIIVRIKKDFEKVELVKEHTALIEKLVKSSPKYKGNEDLLEDFCSETYQKSYLILQSVEDVNSLEAYLKKVISSAIMDVLKNNGRVVRSTKGYSSIKEIPINVSKNDNTTVGLDNNEETTEYGISKSEKLKTEENIFDYDALNEDSQTIEINTDILNTQEEDISEPEVYDNNNRHLYENIPPQLSVELDAIKDPKDSIEEQIIRKDILENIINMVVQIDKEKPEELYLKIFYLRYFQQKKQREIAQDTELSQSEISKRLVQLSRLIKEKLY